MAEKQLTELFQACDKKGTGKIGRGEFQNLCANYGIAPNDADAIFDDLDYDKDGEINMNDFTRGFRDFLSGSGNVDKNSYSGKMQLIERRRSDARLAWSHLVEGIGEGVVQKFLNNR